MIKLGTKTDIGTNHIVIGLTVEDWDELTDGKPIVIEGMDVDVPDVQVLLFGGATVQDLFENIHESKAFKYFGK